MDKLSVSVVIPVFNEAPALAGTLSRFEKTLRACEAVKTFELIVVDDASTDGGIDKLPTLQRAAVLRHETNRGYGASLKTGIRQARYPLIAICDADGSYQIEALPDLLAAWAPGTLVVASRVGMQYPRGHRIKTCMRWVFRLWLRLLAGSDIEDINSGLRVFEREKVLPLLDEMSDRFSFTTSLTLLWTFFGWPIAYVRTNYSTRVGESKVSFVVDSAKVFVQSLRLAVRHRKII